jgi:hypothetical protein
MRWSELIASVGGIRNAYIIFAGNSWRKMPLGRPKRRWDDTKSDLK